MRVSTCIAALFVFMFGLPTHVRAQVSPQGAAVSAAANASKSYSFSVRNTGSMTASFAYTNYPWFHLLNNGRTAANYTLSVSECSGNISGCSVRSNPGTIISGGSADVIVDYHSGPGNDATGTMTLKAESPYGEISTRTLTIVPLSANVSVTTNGSAGGGSAPFAVSDIGNSSPSTYNLGCSYSGVVTGCNVQPSVQVYKGSPQPVTVSYSTNGDPSGGSGLVSLTATYADGINTYTSL